MTQSGPTPPPVEDPASSAPDARHLAATPLLDYDSPTLRALVESRGWRQLSERDRVRAVYDFVRDEIPFGYNACDDLPASQVLADGLGQCNTKGTLLMALLRAVGIPCRLHGFTIHNELQKGAIPGWILALASDEILHSWVEVYVAGEWHDLEGFILDRRYLTAIQRRFPAATGSFCGYGIATTDFRAPPIEWTGGNTYIQREGIARDLGRHDSPDDFYAAHGTNLRGLRRLAYQHAARHLINRNVARLRGPAVGNRRAAAGPPEGSAR